MNNNSSSRSSSSLPSSIGESTSVVCCNREQRVSRSSKIIGIPWLVFAAIIVVLLASIGAHCRVIVDGDGDGTTNALAADVLITTSNDQQQQQQQQSCNIFNNDPIHVLMDRICELCHDMFSHQQPNTRAECRSNCFRTNNFKKCLRLFKPIGTQRNRQVRGLQRPHPLWMTSSEAVARF